MQNKGFVKLFAVLLSLVCLFYLSFSFVTDHWTNKAAEYAQGDAAKQAFYLDSIGTEPIWLGYTFKESREKEIGLGLDLKGGMNVVLEISVADILKSLSDDNQDPTFNAALAAASKAQNTSSEDFLNLFVKEYEALAPNGSLAAIFSTFQLKDKIAPTSTNAQVIDVLRAESSDAISNSFNVLRTRIDRFGVVAPNIQKLDREGRILVELPGVKEPARVRKLLQGSANLEFWETYNLTDFFQQLLAADQTLAALQPSADAAEKATDNANAATLDDAEGKELDGDEIDSLIDAVNDTDSTASTTSEDFAKTNPLLAKLQLNQMNGQIIPGPVVGMALWTDTAAINSMLQEKQIRELFPRDLVFAWSVKAIDEKEQVYQLYALKSSGRGGKPALEGDVITDARDDFQQQANGFEISMAMNTEAAKIWSRLTKENIGKSVAIVLDDVVYSAPRVNDQITGGRSSITGDFTAEEAKDLANVLKSGKMAAKVKIIQEDVIGPSLGQEAIQDGIWSFVAAIILLFIYMIAVYGFVPGMIANVGLLLNLFFTLGMLASFNAVLTLSGIAGLVLTLGVAVDANVLIYERAKEELRAGKGIRQAVEDAYSNAFSAIADANVTSLITGFILFQFGTGPIKGFATTFIIGIISSFFVTVFLSRVFLEGALAKGWFKDITFTTAISKNVLTAPKFDFIGARKKGYMFSGIFILICIGSFFVKGLNQGIEFTGGRNYVVRFEQPVNTVEIRETLAPAFEGASLSVITIGDNNQVRISTNYKVADDGTGVDAEIINKLYTGLKPYLGDNSLVMFETENIQSFQKVGPSIADDIKTGAFIAIVLALLAMGLYILFRFRDIAFSVGTIAAVAHDVIVIIGIYSLAWGLVPFSMEIDQAFIAAILTVIGYSVNDTVVIFDRIREVTHLYPKRDKREIDNEALNSTLARTLSTSISTAIVLVCIFILGGDTIRSFTFAMLVGVILGTYSTLFIAVPMAHQMISGKKDKK